MSVLVKLESIEIVILVEILQYELIQRKIKKMFS